jgi:Fe2+ or Zn2+ uptake regulation protein
MIVRTVFTPVGGYPIPPAVSSAHAAVPPADDRALPANCRTVLQVVEEAGPGSHLTAAQIWERARSLQPRIGFATVHRSLIRLHELGGVLKIDVPGEASAIYEPAAGPHAHFRCTRCGAIRDLDFALPPATLRQLSAEHGVTIDREIVTFSGTCAACR